MKKLYSLENYKRYRCNLSSATTSSESPKKKRKCTLNRKYYNDVEDLEDECVEANVKVEKKALPYITRLTMQNTMIMFKKIVDHPYLVHFPLDPTCEEKALLVDENLVESSGKLMVLDAMLPVLKKRGHKVLIFSTLVMTLDIIEEFMILRNYTYRKLQGSQRLDERAVNIAEFNSDPNILAFLISTKAGGLGLNLTGADTVIFFDCSWNPQTDVQAQDRCHRIGQTRPVVVYILVTKNTIDEKIVIRGQQKRVLEKIVIKDGKFKMNQEDKLVVEDELKDLQRLLEQESCSKGTAFSKLELNQLLDRSDLYEQMKKQQKAIDKEKY